MNSELEFLSSEVLSLGEPNIIRRGTYKNCFFLSDICDIVLLHAIAIFKYFDPEGRQRINRNNVQLDENLQICQEVCHQALKLKEQISKIDRKVGFLQEYLLCIE